jgi:hypothetical protein
MAKKLEGTDRRRARVRRAIKVAANGRPRLSVFRSSKQIYAQVIDDAHGVTLAAASTSAAAASLRAAAASVLLLSFFILPLSALSTSSTLKTMGLGVGVVVALVCVWGGLGSMG